MSTRRRALTLAALAAAALLAPAAAHANPPRPKIPAGLDSEIVGPRTVVHYSPSLTSPAAAQRTDDFAEQTLDFFTSVGLPQPADDGDGHVDIYAFDVVAERNLSGFATTDVAGSPAGYVAVQVTRDGLSAVIHELTHLSQYAAGSRLPGWVGESVSEWVNHVSSGGANVRSQFWDDPSVPLDCAAPAFCDGDAGGYLRWMLWKELESRHGVGSVARMLAAPDVDTGLAASGTSLGGLLGELTMDTLGNRSVPAFAPGIATNPIPFSTLRVNLDQRSLSTSLNLDHLAATYISVLGTLNARCLVAPVRVDVRGVGLAPGVGIKRHHDYLPARAMTPVPGGYSITLRDFSTCNPTMVGVPSVDGPDGQHVTVTVTRLRR